ncbi:hypothetical protein [Aeoliella sp. SH292]|uniref:hypothetical protein n=1 Tax=Aeoliella sp. SH292 TaxID=3454464 RepID=UPI003F98A5BF
MAQLARCPACYSEIELPAEVAEVDLAGARAQCPACEEMFLLADAKPRLVKQAVLVRESTEVAKSERTDSHSSDFSEGAARIAATIDNPTLAAFLGLDKAVKPIAVPPSDDHDAEEEEAAELATPEPKPAIDLGDFQSLDELFKSSSRKTTEPSPPPADVASYEDETEDDQTEAVQEPSPVADRLRPTLGELFAATNPAVGTKQEDNSSPEHDLDRDLADYLNEVEPAQHTKSTVDDFTELTMHDMPVPRFDAKDDFAADDNQASDEGVEVSKSLRAAMGFVDDEPLVAEDSDHELAAVTVGDDADHEEELSFAQVEAPRGTVATRRRKSPSMLRTMFGVVMGGVTGIVGGYLALLWIFHFVGRSEDPLDLAKFYPNIVKPVEYQSSADAPLPIDNPLAANDDIAPLPGTFGDTGDVDQANFETEVPNDVPSDITPEPAEPAPVAWDDPAAAAPLAQPPVKIVIEGAPSYTAAQVQQATAAAQAVAPDLVADGPLDQKKGSSYATLAALADAITFGEGDAKVSWKLPARELYPQLFTTPTNQENIAKIAGYWITSPKRDHGGIFFSGTLDEGRQQGSVAEYQVTLPTGQVLAVLTPQPLDIAAGTPVVVVGSLVRDPATHVEGYSGTADMAAWSEQVLPMAP